MTCAVVTICDSCQVTYAQKRQLLDLLKHRIARLEDAAPKVQFLFSIIVIIDIVVSSICFSQWVSKPNSPVFQKSRGFQEIELKMSRLERLSDEEQQLFDAVGSEEKFWMNGTTSHDMLLVS